jgi:phosphomannomutase
VYCETYTPLFTPSQPVSMCGSTVSSKMLAEIARVEGFYFEDTLTGFKWIGSRSAELSAGKYRNLFGYEEAIGFCCGDVIFDKDGVSAMAMFSEMTLWVYRKGLTLKQHMQSLYDKYGEVCVYCGMKGFDRTCRNTILTSLVAVCLSVYDCSLSATMAIIFFKTRMWYTRLWTASGAMATTTSI